MCRSLLTLAAFRATALRATALRIAPRLLAAARAGRAARLLLASGRLRPRPVTRLRLTLLRTATDIPAPRPIVPSHAIIDGTALPLQAARTLVKETAAGSL